MKKIKPIPKDYLRLPFELYYSGPLSYTRWELMSDKDKVSKPADIKGLRVEQGSAYGVSFDCEVNTGAELYCCMTGGLEGAVPNWLKPSNLEDLNINHAERHGIRVSSTQLTFCEADDEDFEYLESIGLDLDDYRLEEESPDYIILDANGERIKVDSEGYFIDEDGEVDESRRLIDLDLLAEDESLAEVVTLSDCEAQNAWIKEVWIKLFPRRIPVTITR
jgi:hypothetical protein